MNPFAGVAVAMLLSLIPVPGHSAEAAPAPAKSRPNVVFILTDDMRLDDLRYMDFTRRFFRRHGVTFTNAISPHPLCCPARANMVTGQYAQNNGVTANKGPWGGYQALDKSNLIFRWFQSAGYRTSYVGKFLNGYDKAPDKHVPGLTENNMAVERVHNAHGMVVYNNGNPKTVRRHQTYYTTNSAVRSIRKAGTKPFFAWVSHMAPHAMPGTAKMAPNPPKEYRTFDRGDRRPQSLSNPSFNVKRPYSDKKPISRKWVKRVHRLRVLSLYAVDDGVRRIVRTLKRQGVYRDTVLVFTSDNGWGLGSHRMMSKNQPYDDIVRVPLMMAGPGVASGKRVSSVATLVDLPATFARFAGVQPALVQDGRDALSLPADRAVLIQAGDRRKKYVWRGVYTRRYTYVERTGGGTEFYDRANDPHELDPGGEVPQRMKDLLRDLEGCKGDTCQRTY